MSKHDLPIPQLRTVEIQEINNVPNVAVQMNDVTVVTDSSGHYAGTYPNGWLSMSFSAHKDGYVDFSQSFPHLGPGKTFIQFALDKVAIPNLPIRQGLVRSVGNIHQDDTGLFNSLGWTLFPAGWLFNNDRTRLNQNLDFIKDCGDHIRILGEVSGSSWEDRTVDPNAVDWESLATLCYSYNKRLHITIFGSILISDTPAKRQATVDRFIQLAKNNPNAIHSFEIVNEAADNFNDPNEVNQLTNYLRARVPHLVASSSPAEMTSDGIAAWYNNQANYFTYHVDRDDANGTDLWRWLKQFWDVNLSVKLPSNSNEPKGPQSSVAQDADPLRMGLAYGTTALVGAFVIHSGAGVRIGGDYSNNRGIASDLFTVSNINEIKQSINAIQKLLPLDLANYSKQNGQWATSPLNPDYFWPDGHDVGVYRLYSGIGGNTFVSFVLGVKNVVNLKVNQNCSFSIYDPLNGNELSTGTAKLNDTIQLTGPDDSHAGYIIIGQIQ